MKQTLPLSPFEDTITKPQRIWGMIYLPLHAVVLPIFLGMLAYFLPGGLEDTQANIIYYSFGFLFCLICFWGYLREAFDRLCDNKILNLAAFISSYVAYFLLSLVTSVALLLIFGDEISNPNNQTVEEMAGRSTGVVLGLGVFLAPVVEEILFRGVLFGTLRKKNRTLALIVSILAFGLYHVWQYALVTMDWRVLLYAVQYIAPGYALCWLYERSSCIWLPIFMHMGINLVTMLLL